ncbi:hypothetical protein PGTUg99_026288 [Puccinia graminis f. sp. tritici]|uniref:Uncharacterized protein n=1 Tax=Puccinia graminis f. sp. tritici TaxID=56615 RepID=A0A5B0PIG9_PUCGR|nr:hypothetical protein PGTUg99_026288 [Puccinia graminis f. sp. tritici]
MSFLKKADRAEQPPKSAEAHRLGIGFDKFRTSNFHQSTRTRKLPFLSLIKSAIPAASDLVRHPQAHIAFSYNHTRSTKTTTTTTTTKKDKNLLPVAF